MPPLHLYDNLAAMAVPCPYTQRVMLAGKTLQFHNT
jgi:hypothetical protein